MLTIGRNIKAIRELKNFTQEYMAAKLKMSIPNYSNLENSKTELTFSRMQNIAEIFEVDIVQLINFNTDISSINIKDKNKIHCNFINDPFVQELRKQLVIKDEQISRLLELLAIN